MKSYRFLSWKAICRTRALAAILLLFFMVSCGQGTPGVQVPGSGWVARRWVNDSAYAATTPTLPDDLFQLGNTELEVNEDGYVTTNENGQARVRKGSWTCYIFQTGSGKTRQENYQACARGATCTTTCSGSGLTVVTLPATITIHSTVTFVYYEELQAVVVLTSQGAAEVVPTGQGMPGFVVGGEEGGNGAYAVLPGYEDKAMGFFGFGPGEIRKFQDFVIPIQVMGQARQLESANLVLREENVPGFPIPESYFLVLRWVDDAYDARVANGILHTTDLLPLFENQLRDIPVFFSVRGEMIDARSVDFNPDLGKQLFAEAGYSETQTMILAYEEKIPGAYELAQQIAKDLGNSGLINFKLVPINLLDNPNILEELKQEGLPILHLGAD